MTYVLPSMSAPHINMLRYAFSFSLILSVMLFSISVFAQRVETPPQPEQEDKPIAASPAKKPAKNKRIREGTIFNGKVFFRAAGERTVLYTVENNQRYNCLENLALERVLTAIQEKPERQTWKIEGVFTEFRGENYILIRRASVSQ